MEKILNYIDGQLHEPIDGEYIDNFEPAKGEVYSLIPKSNEKDVNKAVEAAKSSFKAWSETPKDERAAILYRISELIEENAEMLAQAESKDNGKPVSSGIYLYKLKAGNVNISRKMLLLK